MQKEHMYQMIILGTTKNIKNSERVCVLTY